MDPINDRCNQRAQVYTSEFEYVATIGETDVIGDGPNQFHWPSEVAIDSSGAIYVTDSGNGRVQKCTVDGTSGSCVTFIATSEVEIEGGNPFNPQSIAIDSEGRVIISDNANSRVLVFDGEGNHPTIFFRSQLHLKRPRICGQIWLSLILTVQRNIIFGKGRDFFMLTMGIQE